MNDDDDRIERGPFRGWSEALVALYALLMVIALVGGSIVLLDLHRANVFMSAIALLSILALAMLLRRF